MTRQDIIKAGYHIHHTSYARGYIKVNTEKVEEYKGRFGKGYKIYCNNPKSTQYCLVDYFIK